MSDRQTTLTTRARYLVLVTAFLGWFFGGVVMSTSALSMRSASINLLSRVGVIDWEQFDHLNTVLQEHKREPDRPSLTSVEQVQLNDWNRAAQAWFGYYTCAMLFGAAAGGLLFGRIGDRVGRSSAMAGSILCYSLLSAVAYFAQTPVQLLVLWFLACLGVGGMWPNGVALVSECWSNMSRPMVAGIMGASANIGLFAAATLGTYINITPEHWRWMLLVCAAPIALGVFALIAVPESPIWLAARARSFDSQATAQMPMQIFRPPLLGTTLIGIALATVPLVGGWGSATWMVPWAAEAGETSDPPNPKLQAQVHQYRALPGMLGTFLGGWAAHLLGRRLSFCLMSFGCLVCAQWIFWFLLPTDPSFLAWVAALGFFNGFYFGWLPLFLPELFPTAVRATGAGVSFNFGRFVTAITVFATAALTAYFGSNYAQIGRVTSLIFAIGMFAIWLAPDTSQRQLED